MVIAAATYLTQPICCKKVAAISKQNRQYAGAIFFGIEQQEFKMLPYYIMFKVVKVFGTLSFLILQNANFQKPYNE
ncbi:hypothetical protein C7N43_14910 [Sphingobacteriales bacterium UPWRP_1]|nr:hypothetical protein BVG80_04780 [Sphingobacteriales bacterium TSM_CSM]PSJ76204.1 hypothetical protein C7N43_14910 [Sphingobacteriales bacterium UPWRP_1]